MESGNGENAPKAAQETTAAKTNAPTEPPGATQTTPNTYKNVMTQTTMDAQNGTTKNAPTAAKMECVLIVMLFNAKTLII